MRTQHFNIFNTGTESFFTPGTQLASIARVKPDAPAVIYVSPENKESVMTWRELHELSNRIAWYLLGQGIGPGKSVLAALQEETGLDENTAKRVAAGFGGGSDKIEQEKRSPAFPDPKSFLDPYPYKIHIKSALPFQAKASAAVHALIRSQLRRKENGRLQTGIH